MASNNCKIFKYTPYTLNAIVKRNHQTTSDSAQTMQIDSDLTFWAYYAAGMRLRFATVDVPNIIDGYIVLSMLDMAESLRFECLCYVLLFVLLLVNKVPLKKCILSIYMPTHVYNFWIIDIDNNGL